MATQTSITWLKTASAIFIIFGLVIAAASLAAADQPARFLLDLMFFPIDQAQLIHGPEIRLVGAVCGGVMVGWGLLLWLIATRLYPRDAKLARTMILISTGGWFVVDSIGSILAGAPLNAVFNIGFLLAFWLPILRTPADQKVAS